jgi:hypothetical protein
MTDRHRAAAGTGGVPSEEIARMAGHKQTRTTEPVYRRELRPVMTTGAEVADKVFFRSLERCPAPGLPTLAEVALESAGG